MQKYQLLAKGIMIESIPAVLDTNVLVSAFWSADGVPSKIVHLIPDGIFVPCYSDEILREYEEVLLRPAFNFTAEQVNELLEKYKKYGRIVSPEPSSVPLFDEADRIFYDVAKEESALLVTGNIRHFPKENFIMLPNDFYRYVLGRQN